MKRTRWFAGLLALLMVGSIVGCNVTDPDTTSSESIVTSSTSEDNTSDTESSGVVSEDGVVSDSSVGDASVGDNTSKGNNNTSTTSSGSTAIKFGVTTTKKMPNYISKITSPNLKVLASDRGNEKTEAEFIKAFKAVTGKDLKIERTVVEWNSMPNRLAGMVMANASPDIFTISNIMAPYLVKKPYFEDIEKYIDLNDALWKPSKDANTSLFTYKGKRYCVVSGGELGVSSGSGYIYNKKLVNEAISANKKLYDPLQMFYDGKWTWDTLYEFVNEINLDSNGDGVPEVYGHIMEGSRINAYLMTTGEDIIKTDAKGNFVYNLESPNVIRALNFIKKLGKVCNDPAPWEGLSKVVAGKAGFYFGSAFWMKDSSDSIKAKKEGKIAWVPMPRDPQTSTVYTSTAGDAMFIPLNAKNPYLAGAYYYFTLYLNKNPNPALEKKTQEVYKNEYGWTDDEIKLYTGKVTVPNLKGIISGYGERIDGFDKDTYWGKAFDPDTTVAKLIESVGPGLKQAITRFNKS